MSATAGSGNALAEQLAQAAAQLAGAQQQDVLPALREDLRIMETARQVNGERAWVIFDPLRHRYFQIDARNLAILREWPRGSARAVIQALSERNVTVDDINALVRFLHVNSLTLEPIQGDVRNYVNQARAGQHSWWMWLVHNYLFMRFPLVRPHRFLNRTVGYTDLFFSTTWWWVVAMCALVGGYLALRQWDAFLQTFLHFFSLEGVLFYMLALAFVKVAHELGHAYTATRYGCRVATMGVAFLVLLPVLFTDTTDSWKLKSRAQRLRIAAAGVAVELTIAVFATLLWAFLPDGAMRSAAFFVATTSWVFSLAVNLNPLMRFDGYHFLSDLIGVQNLQERCFAIGRWQLREILFGLREPTPEPLTRRRRRMLALFAWATWTYRFFLFLTIAFLLHEFFFRGLGNVLAGIEIGFFILVPIMRELHQWWERRAAILTSARSRATLAVVVVLLLVFLFPWQSSVRFPAVVEAREGGVIHARGPGQITEIHVASGDAVQTGDRMISLHSPGLVHQIAQSERRIALLEARLARIAADPRELETRIVLQGELRQEERTLSGLREELMALNVLAPFDGTVTDMDPALHVGRWINTALPLANVASVDGARARGYISAPDLRRLRPGDPVRFVPEAHERAAVEGRILSVADANSERISVASLTSTHGGPIAVSDVEGSDEPIAAWYGVVIELPAVDTGPDRVLRGQVHASANPESLATRVWRQVMRVVIRETTI